jgi:Multidrug resistance efflux pump
VQPETEVKISPEVAGEIIELPVEDGKEVKKGS